MQQGKFEFNLSLTILTTQAEMVECLTHSFADLELEDIKLRLNRWEHDTELQARQVEIKKLEKEVDELSKNNQLLKDDKAKLSEFVFLLFKLPLKLWPELMSRCSYMRTPDNLLQRKKLFERVKHCTEAWG
ncbi:hypothetical protein PtA15_16A91 [Puccinia triticina]|uniref:Uncharacterized protein n=1 Tax=Puccinia triticina TaxID=208348 RepID=A0ABY7D4L9_9BASI|nr:uncharacterized protein PtA15_16A91 [Puccinia triticina]WAQ92185.1 hypothetical protein PtA15_16A91 [Puccinia triticina]